MLFTAYFPSELNCLWLFTPILSKGFHPGDGLQEVGHISLPSFQLGKPRWVIDLGKRRLYSRICVAVPPHLL